MTERKQRLGKTEGITLVALVVTIIVLLILAGVSISMVIGNNGVLNQAERVVKENTKGSIQEELEMEVAGWQVEKYISNKTLEEVLPSKYTVKYNEDGTYEVKVTEKGTEYIFTVTEDGKVTLKETDKGSQTDEPEELIYSTSDGSFSKVTKINTPKLGANMTAIYWEGTEVKELNEESSEEDWKNWYNYNDSRWANAVTKNAEGEITGYYVWIPRYAYQITSQLGNYVNASTAGDIEVVFIGLDNKDDTGEIYSEDYPETTGRGTASEKMEDFVVHPAFIDDVEKGGWTTDLPGIWVGKFEASGYDKTTGAYVASPGDNIGTYDVRTMPGVSSWRSIKIGNMYTNSINMNTSLKSHMMKNSEWGAVAYLSRSEYGRTTEIGKNGSSSYITGGDAGTAYATANTNQSTTNNVYGVYDMSGGTYEYTANFVANTQTNLTTYGGSFASTASNPQSTEYVTVYKMGSDNTRPANYAENSNKYGDGVYETSKTGEGATSWYGDYSYFPYSSGPFFGRGGIFNSSDAGAGMFYFDAYDGSTNSFSGFRVVLSL